MVECEMTEKAHQIIVYHDEAKGCFGGPKILETKVFSPKFPLSKREQKVRKEIPACNNKSGHAFGEIKVLLHFFCHPPNNH